MVALEDFLGYDDLLAFASTLYPAYDKSNVSRLWTTMTAYLPTDDKDCFIVIAEDNKRLSLEAYKSWYAEADHATCRRNINIEGRRKWKLARILIEYFAEYSEFLSPREIQEYGPASRKLLKSWLSSF